MEGKRLESPDLAAFLLSLPIMSCGSRLDEQEFELRHLRVANNIDFFFPPHFERGYLRSGSCSGEVSSWVDPEGDPGQTGVITSPDTKVVFITLIIKLII